MTVGCFSVFVGLGLLFGLFIMASRILERDDESIKVRDIDKGIKNPWKWDWVTRSVGDELVSQHIRKLKCPGLAYCNLCQKDIQYGNRGWKALEQHLKKNLHQNNKRLRATNQSLSAAFGQNKQEATRVPYGLHPFFTVRQNVVQEREVQQTLTPLSDRVKNMEAMFLRFIAENCLSFSVVPKLINLAQTVSQDQKALASISMSRTTASYKTIYGVGTTFLNNVISSLKNVYFSFNIDESTSSNLHRVLSVLVSYFCPERRQVVVQHLSSISCVKVNSEALFNEIASLMDRHQLPWGNLMSILMDSCNVMRGSKTGLETRIRSVKAPHLLDIDGDVCHHVHNAAKAFCKPFNNIVENLFIDIHNDFKWSPDICQLFSEVCVIMNIRYSMPQRYLSHRWLSVLDVSQDIQRLFDALTVLYSALLLRDENQRYLPVLAEIYLRHDVSALSKNKITELKKQFKEKKLTPDGKNRKERILQKLFNDKKYTKMIMGLYVSVLPLLKNFVLLFESKQPLIHELHDKQIKLLKEFLSCYLKPEKIGDANTATKLKKLDVVSNDNLLKTKDMFMGIKALNLVEKNPRDHNTHKFLEQVKNAYVSCGKCLQDKLAITNPFLKAVGSIHPDAAGHSVTLSYLLKLPRLVPTVLSTEDEVQKYDLEVRKYQVDNLPDFAEGMRIDDWWGKEVINNKFPVMSKLVRAILSRFHGPQVEGSFSIMNEVLDERSGRMNMATYNALQTVKYYLNTYGKSSVEYFKKKDVLHDKIDRNLVRNMVSAASQYKEELKEKREEKERHKELVGASVRSKEMSKRKAKEICNRAAKHARLCHIEKISNKK